MYHFLFLGSLGFFNEFHKTAPVPSMEDLTTKVNDLMGPNVGLDLALCLVANNPQEPLEMRLLASSTLTNARF